MYGEGRLWVAGAPEGMVIRPVSVADAEALHEIRTLPSVMWGTLQLPSLTVEGVRRRLENSTADPQTHSFVAVLDGQVVGSAALHVGSRRRSRVADLGLMVHDEYTGRGIGRALMERLLDVADNWLGLKRVDLEVVTDNEAAVHLYESLGFEREGVRRCSVFRGGVFVDTLMMGRVR